MKRASILAMACTIGLGTATALSAQDISQVRQFNTVKQKLAAGERVVERRDAADLDPRAHASVSRPCFFAQELSQRRGG